MSSTSSISSSPVLQAPIDRRLPRALRPLALAAAIASAGAFAAAPAQALTNFSGLGPVWGASWYNGSYTEVFEFGTALDWQGYCNAHPTAICTVNRFWGHAGNWETLSVPTVGSDVRVEAGKTVRVAYASSIYQGNIITPAVAGTVSASGRVELLAPLSVQSGSFADLAVLGDLFGSRLTTSGVSTVQLLSAGRGSFGGNGGTTLLGNWQGPGLTLDVANLHTVTIYGGEVAATSGAMASATSATPMASTGSLLATLAPQAVLRNDSVLNFTSATVMLQGTANANTLPRLVNAGSISGPLALNGVRLENNGQLAVAAGETLVAAFGGSHSGHFTGGNGSTMVFQGLGSAGHTFSTGSSVSTAGAVTFGSSNHTVAGSFSADSVSVVGGASVVANSGWTVLRISVGEGQSFSTLDLNATPAPLTELTITGSRASFNAAGSTSVQTLNMSTGSLGVAGELVVAGNTTLFESVVFGGGTLRLNGVTNLNGSGRELRSNVVNTGTIRWNAGELRAVQGTIENRNGALIELRGDFNATPAAGRIANAGQFTKTLGSGTATIKVALDNTGTVKANQGQLVLAAGGRHSGSLVAAAGARIELQGAVDVQPGFSSSGAVDFYTSSLFLRSGATLNMAGTPLVLNFGDFNSETGSTLNANSAFGFYAQGNFLNRGSVVAANNFIVGGASFDNRGLLNLTNSVYSQWSGGINTGSIVNGSVGNVYLSGGGAFVNNGAVQNAGSFRNDGLMTLQGDGFVNTGFLDNQGRVMVAAGAVLNNSGQILHSGESFEIVAGANVLGTGSYRQEEGGAPSLTRINGTLAAAGGVVIESGVLAGAGTVVGDLTLGEFAQLKPGNSPGTFTVNGNLSINGNPSAPVGQGNVQIELGAGGVHDRVVVSGNAGVFGSLDLIALPGAAVVDGDSIVWLTAGSSSVNATMRTQGLPAGFTATLSGNGRQLDFFNAAATQIALSGDVLVAASEARSNSLSASEGYPSLNRLDNFGSFSNRVGASLYAQVLFNAPGAAILNRALISAGDFDNQGSLINRGSVSALQVSQLSNRGVLNNEGQVQSTNSFFNAAGGQITSSGSIQVFNGPNENRNEGQITVAGSFSTSYGLRNDGQMAIQSGASFTAGNNGAGGFYLQTAGSTVVDGTLTSELVWINNPQSQLSGHGTVQAALLHSGGGSEFLPGTDGGVGTLTLTGALDAQAVQFFIDVAGSGQSDRLVVGGAADLIGSAMNFRLLGNYRPAIGDSFSWLTAGGGITNLNAANWRIEVLDQGAWTLWADPNGIYDPNAAAGLSVAFGLGTVAFVPEPSTWMLWLCGAAVLLRLRHRLNPQSAY